MLRRLLRGIGGAVLLAALAVPSMTTAQPTTTYVRVASLSSTMDGVFQWVRLDVVRVGTTPLELKGRRLTVTDRHGGVRSFTFPAGADGANPPATIGIYAWAGEDEVTNAYCDELVCYPGTDVYVPGYLLPIDGGTVVIEGMDELAFGPLPVQGCAYRLRDGSDFTWSDPWEGPCLASVVAREYHHAGLDHDFTTTRVDEMLALARGATPGWTPTGKAQRYALTPWIEAVTPVCRLLLLDPVRYSHFLSASPAECASIAAGGGAVLESPALFHVALPIVEGCKGRITHPSGAWKPVDLGAPVYRLWNGKVPPNHRYVTDEAERDAMVARGWVLEAAGAHGIAWCASAGSPIPPAPTP